MVASRAAVDRVLPHLLAGVPAGVTVEDAARPVVQRQCHSRSELTNRAHMPMSSCPQGAPLRAVARPKDTRVSKSVIWVVGR